MKALAILILNSLLKKARPITFDCFSIFHSSNEKLDTLKTKKKPSFWAQKHHQCDKVFQKFLKTNLQTKETPLDAPKKGHRNVRNEEKSWKFSLKLQQAIGKASNSACDQIIGKIWHLFWTWIENWKSFCLFQRPTHYNPPSWSTISVTNKFASKCATIWPKCAQKSATAICKFFLTPSTIFNAFLCLNFFQKKLSLSLNNFWILFLLQMVFLVL